MSDPNNRQMSLFDEKPLDTKLTPSIHEEYTQLVEKLNFSETGLSKKTRYKS